MAGAVAVIDTQFNNVIATIDVGPFPSGVVVAPHGTRAYSNTVTATVRGNPFPSTVTITPDGNFAYVLDTESNPQVIDTTTRESTFPLERVIDGTGRIAFAPDGLLAYVAEFSRALDQQRTAGGSVRLDDDPIPCIHTKGCSDFTCISTTCGPTCYITIVVAAPDS
jgi:YVTN family beta-propeller protein